MSPLFLTIPPCVQYKTTSSEPNSLAYQNNKQPRRDVESVAEEAISPQTRLTDHIRCNERCFGFPAADTDKMQNIFELQLFDTSRSGGNSFGTSSPQL